MKAAFSVWNDRLSPVFDVAQRLHLLELEENSISAENDVTLPLEIPSERALRLIGLGIDELVCGAISRPMEIAIVTRGIKVIPFISGDYREIVQAWLDGTLHRRNFIMPGCCRRRMQRSSTETFFNREDSFMNGKGQGGMGGGGRGGGMGGGGGRGGGMGGGMSGGGMSGGGMSGGGVGGRGRMGGPTAGGPDGFCVCPKCGRKEPHQRGVPCTQIRCPDCGIAMTREA